MSGVLTVNPYEVKEDVYPMDDVVIDAPRAVAYTDNLWGGSSVITQNKNQSKDLRGDIAPLIHGVPQGQSASMAALEGNTQVAPPGASLPTYGGFNLFTPVS
jgi:hypothetical protein